MLDRIEELKHKEQLLYSCIDYLVTLWKINETSENIKAKFRNLGFTEEEIKEIEFMFD